MAKKRIIVPILLLVLVLVMAAGVFVACDKTPDCTITFGDTSLTVKQGTALTAEQIPNYEIAPGSRVVFDGWFVGETKIEAGYVVNEDVVAEAKTATIYYVTFMAEDGQVAKNAYRAGTVVAVADFPAPDALLPANSRHVGWLLYNNLWKADESIVVNGDITMTAAWVTIGAEEGEYTLEGGATLKLFGHQDLEDYCYGQFGDIEITYVYGTENTITVLTPAEEQCEIKLDLEHHTYQVADILQGEFEFKSFGIVNYTFDGYGNVAYADSYDQFSGTYTITGNVVKFSFTDPAAASLGLDGAEYEIAQEGNALLREDEYYGGIIAITRKGWEVPAQNAQKFVGIWQAEDGTVIDIAIDPELGTIVKIDGEEVSYRYVSFNYDCTVLTANYVDYKLVDGKLVDAGYDPDDAADDVVYTKKDAEDVQLTVTFKNGEEIVATATVSYGGTVAEEDVPSDPLPELAFAFDGWYNGYDAFDETAPVYANVTYVAEFEQVQAIVVFKNGSEEVSKFAVDFGAKLTAENIPQAVSGNGTFIGWYNGDKKAEVGTSIATLTTTFTAQFVNEADYAGNWSDANNGEYIIFGEDHKVSGLGKSNITWTFDAETGEAKFSTVSYSSKHDYSMLIVNNKLIVADKYYDSIEEDFVTKTYTMSKKTGETATYYKDKNADLVVNNGIITNWGGAVYWGTFTKSGSRVMIKVKANSSSSIVTINGKVDENGNIVISGQSTSRYNGIWISGTTERQSFYNRDAAFTYVYKFTTEKGVTYTVLNKDNTYAYATVVGDLADGSEATVTSGETTLVIKVSGTSFQVKGAEAGTYTNVSEGTLVLDGFGTATVTPVDGAEMQFDYFVFDEKVFVGNAAVVLNGENFEPAQAIENGLNNKFILSGSTKYDLTLYNCGVLAFNNYGTMYYGKYTVNADKNVVISGVSYSINGTWTVEESGNVLINGSKVYVADGYQVAQHKDELIGNWVDADSNEITITEGAIVYQGTSYSATWNYNGSVLTFQAADSRNYYATSKLDHVVVLDGENIVITHTYYTGYDDVYEELTGATEVVETFAKKVVVEADAFAGTWNKVSGNLMDSLTFDGFGKVTVGSTEVSYIVNGNGNAEFTYNYTAYTAVLSGDTLTCSWYDDEYGNTYEGTYAKESAEEPALDAFAGTYKNGSNELIINGDGTGSFNGTAFTYTIDSVNKNKINISAFGAFDADNNSAVLSGNELTLDIDDSYQENHLVQTLTKEIVADPSLDAFAGTWKFGDITFAFDGEGQVVVTGGYAGTAAYTVNGNTATFYLQSYYETITCVLQEDGTLKVSDESSEWLVNSTFTKA